METVRRHIAAFRENDAASTLSDLDRYVVLDSSRVRDIETFACGHEEVIEWARHYVGAFEDYDYEPQRLTDLGSGVVLAAVTEKGRGKHSGAPVRQFFAALYTVIDGKIARITLFPSEEQALEAVGLSE